MMLGHDMPRPDRVALDQSFDVTGLSALRTALVAHASGLGVADVRLDRLILIGSELATNAVRHGGGSGRLRLWRGDGSPPAVYCEVSDRGPGISDEEIGRSRAEPTAIGGRGIWLCRQMSDAISIRPAKPGTMVTVAIHLA
jgi:anti-sigma regulatory factor (Ser/Thr protein kinase)